MARPEYLQNTTLQRVLLIPELLDMVFSYLDASDNTINARVCRRWSNIALDILWRDVEDMRRLFSLLAPLHLAITSEYVSFATKPPTFVFIELWPNRNSRGSLSQATGSGLNVMEGVFDGCVIVRETAGISQWRTPCSTISRGHAPA